MMSYVVYGREDCGWCRMAKQFLGDRQEEFRYIDISQDDLSKAYLQAEGHKTVPQIYANGAHIGGYTDLVSLFGEGSYGDNA